MKSLKFRLLSAAVAAGLLVPVGFVLAQNQNQANQNQQRQEEFGQGQVQQRAGQPPGIPRPAQQVEGADRQQAQQAEQAAQQAQQAAQQQAQQEGRDRPTETETAREYAEQQQRQGQDGRDAMRHFLAGYYAGYSDGYFDGSDDLVLHIIEMHRMRAPGPGYTQMHPEHIRHRGMAHERIMSEMMGGPRREQRLSGTVLNTRRASFGESEHLLAFIETPDGVGRIADLGPVDNLQNVQIQEGDRISLRGESFFSGDRQMFAASQVQIGDETIQVQQQGQGQNRQQVGTDQIRSERRTFRGEADPQQDRSQQGTRTQQQPRQSEGIEQQRRQQGTTKGQGQTGRTEQRSGEQQGTRSTTEEQKKQSGTERQGQTGRNEQDSDAQRKKADQTKSEEQRKREQTKDQP